MNNSKKLQVKKVKEVKISEKPITSISKPWIITSAVLVLLLIGAMLFDQLYQPTMMTVDGKKYHMKDLSYYIYNIESTYASYDQMISGYWDMTADEKSGETNRDMAKVNVMTASAQNEILYNEAKSENYELTSDEKNTISTNVDNLLQKQMSADVKKKNGFTKASLTKVLGKITLAERYRNDIIDTLDVDDKAIKDGITYADYRQYDIEYIFVPTQTNDDSGAAVDVSADEKTAAYDKISAIYDKAKSTEDWSKLLPAAELELQYKDTNFVQSGSTFSEDFENMMIKMKNKDVSAIYEDKTGYYIVRMKDNNSSESYDSEVENQITYAENKAFTEYYDSTIVKKHTYSFNEKEFESLTMGNITL